MIGSLLALTLQAGGLYTAPPISGTRLVVGTRAGHADTTVVTIVEGVAVGPGQSIQSAVDSNPPGTTFLLQAGTYPRQSVIPKNRDNFIGQPGTVLDGENVALCAFCRSGPNPDTVTIKNLRVTRYNTPSQMGAINGGYFPVDGTEGWAIDSVEADHNAQCGIRVGHRMKVRWAKLHDNGLNGICGAGDDVLVESTEIAFNGGIPDGGGTKLVLTNRLTFRNNYVHDNPGPGLWADIANRGFLIEGNRVERNLQEGIVIEISYNGVIRNNAVRWNGLLDPRRTSWLWGAGIGIHSSGGSGIEIYGNTLEGNAHGIVMHQQRRGCRYQGEPPCSQIDSVMLLQNVSVHDNTVACGPGSLSVAGAAQEIIGDTVIFTLRNLHFTRNTYTFTGCGGFPFRWLNGDRTFAQWKGYGNDVVAAPDVTVRGIGVGAFNATPGSLGTLFINANSPSNLKSQLAAAEVGGYCIFAAPTGGSHTQYKGANGQWSLAIWKSKIDDYAGDTTWAHYAKRGTLCGLSIVDEPQCSSCWFGFAIPWNTVGQAACYAKTIFPGVPIYTRTNPSTIASGTACLGAGMVQYDASMGNPATVATTQNTAAKAKGLLSTGGVNYDNGGKVVSGCIPSESRPGQCSMSAVELSVNIRKLAADTSVICGVTMWGPNAARWQTYSAIPAIRDTLKSLASWGKTRQRPKGCGG